MAGEFTDYLEADDWKNAAAIVGLIRFLTMHRYPITGRKLSWQKKFMTMIPNMMRDWISSNLMHLISRRKSWMRLLRITLLKNCIIVRRSGHCIRQNGRKRKLTLLTVS